MNLPKPSKLRTFLILGRVSNLPTVWSNCLAGWWLAGPRPWGALFSVSLWASLMYVGGMFLNDAFDAGFDRNHRPTRPIPSGQIGEGEVWIWGFGWLIIGFAGFCTMGKTTAILATFLALAILVYNAIHKMVVLAPLVMGLCRFFVYLAAASVAFYGVIGEVVWKALALAGYVVGLSCLARKETAPVRIQYWPAILLATPIFVAVLFDDGLDKRTALFGSVLLAGWAGWTLLQTYGKAHPNVGNAVSRLLAGICIVDFLAVADMPHFTTLLFFLYFLIALALQRAIPAT
jgi:4-hydroxybenzoate polyprenyltransferase